MRDLLREVADKSSREFLWGTAILATVLGQVWTGHPVPDVLVGLFWGVVGFGVGVTAVKAQLR